MKEKTLVPKMPDIQVNSQSSSTSTDDQLSSVHVQETTSISHGPPYHVEESTPSNLAGGCACACAGAYAA